MHKLIETVRLMLKNATRAQITQKDMSAAVRRGIRTLDIKFILLAGAMGLPKLVRRASLDVKLSVIRRMFVEPLRTCSLVTKNRSAEKEDPYEKVSAYYRHGVGRIPCLC